jgi:hypothetical protein
MEKISKNINYVSEIAFLTNQAIRYLTVSVVPVISTNNLVSPLVAGPETNDPSELKFDP